MKVLLDTCVWGRAADALREAGHEVDWIGELETDPGDLAIIERAIAEKSVVVTLDKDFGEIAVVRGLKHSGIIRLVGIAARRQGPMSVDAIAKYGTDLMAGAILTVEAARVRIRTAE